MRRAVVLFLLTFLLLVPVPPQQNRKHRVTLAWQAPVLPPGEKIVGYNVYRSGEENGHYELIAEKVSALTYIDSAVQSGHTYYYRVTSLNAKGRESAPATTKATVP